MKFLGVLLMVLICAFPAFIFAETEVAYSFDSPAQQQLFSRLTTESRCLVCQNQSLADSDAPLAVDLRNIIYSLVRQDKDDKFIQDFLITRYGNYILLRPPLNKNTWMLWVSPFLLFLLGFGVLIYYVRRK